MPGRISVDEIADGGDTRDGLARIDGRHRPAYQGGKIRRGLRSADDHVIGRHTAGLQVRHENIGA